MRSMINKIMESIYTRQYMATHSYTGRASPANKRERIPAKPAMPTEELKAIRCKHLIFLTNSMSLDELIIFYQILVFVTSYWARKHKITLSPKLISLAIQDKLSTEHREWKRIGRLTEEAVNNDLNDEDQQQ